MVTGTLRRRGSYRLWAFAALVVAFATSTFTIDVALPRIPNRFRDGR